MLHRRQFKATTNHNFNLDRPITRQSANDNRGYVVTATGMAGRDTRDLKLVGSVDYRWMVPATNPDPELNCINNFFHQRMSCEKGNVCAFERIE